MTLTYGSLFTGIGGFDLGFDQTGLKCAWQVEKDAHCLKLLTKYWPDVPKYGDITNVTGLPTVSIICGGFPCQDVSIAGNRRGLAGERSGLWFEFLRIITELNPPWVIIENVPGLLSSNDGRDLAAILYGLEKCGYWWAYRILDSQFFGVPQRRRRVFIVASLTRGLPQKVLFESESSPWDTPPGRETGEKVAGTITKRFAGGSNQWPPINEADNLIPIVSGAIGQTNRARVTNDITESLRADSHGAIPMAFGGNNTKGPVSIARRCNAHPSKRYDFESETFVCNAFNGYTGGADDNDAQGNHIVIDARNGVVDNNITSTLQAKKNGYSLNALPLIANPGIRRLTPLECERLQGFPDGWTEGQNDTHRYRQLGNAVTVNVARWLGGQLVKIGGAS